MAETPEELLALADELYAGLPDAFTEARNAAAKAAEKPMAAEIKQLKKPSVAAWAVNLLVRVESEQIDSVLALGASLRAAAEALDGEELRALTRQRRQLTSALATSARSHAKEAGVRLTPPVVDQVEGMLTAAMLDPVAAQVVRTGRVLTAFTSTGVSDLDVTTVVALPDDLDVEAVARAAPEQGEPAPPELTVVEGGRAKIAAAEEALEAARGELERVRATHAEVEEEVATLRARRLQLQGEADELRRRLAAIDDDVEELDEELEEAEDAEEEAAADLRAAQETESAAAARVAELT